MDVRVGASPMTATAEMVEAVVVSILAIPASLVRHLALVVAPTRIRSIGNSSLSAVPAPFVLEGGLLASAA